MVVDKLTEKLEALLFASGRAMEISKLTDLVEEKYKRNVIKSLEKIREQYDKRNSPMMVVEQDNMWKLTVREEYLPLVRKIVSDMELPRSVLETLAVIAWKSPMMQSQLIKVRTNKAYEHIDLLERLGFINKTKAGRSFRLSLAEKFFEYFDVKDGDIRKVFKDAKGVEKELEAEHQKHLGELKSEDEGLSDENIVEVNLGKQLIEEEKDHLGSLEVVDALSQNAPDDVEIVDAISPDEEEDEVQIEETKFTKSDKIKSLARATEEDSDADIEVEEVEDIIEELDEEDEAKEEIEELLEEAIEEEKKEE